MDGIQPDGELPLLSVFSVLLTGEEFITGRHWCLEPEDHQLQFSSNIWDYIPGFQCVVTLLLKHRLEICRNSSSVNRCKQTLHLPLHVFLLSHKFSVNPRKSTSARQRREAETNTLPSVLEAWRKDKARPRESVVILFCFLVDPSPSRCVLET